MAYIVRRNPAGNGAVLNDLDRVWESLVSDRGSYPPVDIIENEDDYTLIADLPGVTESGLEARIEDRMLIIESVDEEKKDEAEKETRPKYLIRERRARKFRRSFVVPKDADLDAVSAAFSNGVLTLTIAKRPESKPRSIEIKRA